MAYPNLNNKSSTFPTLLVYLVLLGAGLFLIWRLWPGHVGFAGRGDDGPGDPTAKPRAIAEAAPLTQEEKDRIAIYERWKGSVVHVTSLEASQRFSLNMQRLRGATGTGFVWDEKGRIVTNYHVIKGANKAYVTLADQSKAEVYRAVYDESKDLAVLFTDATKDKLKPLELGQSSKLKIGQNVIVIGNPFGLDHTLTTGIVSALGREIEAENGHTIKNLIQVDAAINPGNSGGPLLDGGGRLIGVTTAILSPSGGWAGVGLAIPVDEVNRVVPQLIRGVREGRPTLGIVGAPDQWASERGIDGILIINLTPGGPAEQAGLRPTRRDENGRIHLGDIIKGIDDHEIHNTNDLYTALENYSVGQEVTIHFQRGDKNQTVKLKLGASRE